ncbi:MAG: glycerol kinase GlpK, partial [Thermomicrobiales bacterium]|nr:glycerol kinase GlpK [Thermomicrobiales bacterium]
ALVWQDRRTADLCRQLKAQGTEAMVTAKTGLLLDPYFSATKIAWLLERLPDLRPLAERGDVLFGTVETWLLWNLANGAIHATDAANASRTMLLDLHSGAWSEPLLEDLRIPPAMLPCVIANSGPLAEIDARHFGRALPLTGMAGDQQAALFGQACFAPGQAKNTYGTGSFLLLTTGSTPTPCHNRILSTIAWRLSAGETTYAREGAIFSTGSAVQWLRDGLGIIPDASAVEPLAASVPDSGGVFLVPAFTGLGAPHWDAAARGAVLGLTPGSTAAHLARATLEAIAFQTRDVVDAMTASGGVPLRELRVDGGAARNDLLLQIQADSLGVPVLRPANVETTALGAAYLAGLGAGLYDGLPEIARHWRAERVFEPRISADERNTHHAQWRRAVNRALRWEHAGASYD